MQCHIGTDTLEWARLGAEVMGVDFSPSAIVEAERFAKLLGLETARFKVASVQEAPRQLLGEQFDVLYTGRGALCWLPDLRDWAKVCAQLVKPGGVLYLEESHPMLNMLDVMETDRGKVLAPKYDLFNEDPVSETSEGSYADPKAKTGLRTSHMWEFRFDTLINALIENGFRIDFLHERPLSCFKPWDDEFFVTEGSHYWRLRDDLPALPMSFTLHATLLQ